MTKVSSKFTKATPKTTIGRLHNLCSAPEDMEGPMCITHLET